MGYAFLRTVIRPPTRRVNLLPRRLFARWALPRRLLEYFTHILGYPDGWGGKRSRM